MCFVFIWEQKATCATYSINCLVFITETKSVYSAVRTGSLNKAVCASSLKGGSSGLLMEMYYFIASHGTNFSTLRTEISIFKGLELHYIQPFQPLTKHQNMFQQNVAAEGFTSAFAIRVIHIGGGGESLRRYRRQQCQVLYALHITRLSRSSFFWKETGNNNAEIRLYETRSSKSNIRSPKPEIRHLNQKRNGASLSEGALWRELGGPRRIC